MFPLVGIAATIRRGMSAYRDLFSRRSAFEHVERYINGLLLSVNKTQAWAARGDRGIWCLASGQAHRLRLCLDSVARVPRQPEAGCEERIGL